MQVGINLGHGRILEILGNVMGSILAWLRPLSNKLNKTINTENITPLALMVPTVPFGSRFVFK